MVNHTTDNHLQGGVIKENNLLQQQQLISVSQNQIRQSINLLIPNHVNSTALISEKSQNPSLPPPNSNTVTNSTATSIMMANTTTTSTALASTTTNTTVPMNYIKKFAVCVNRMKEEHIRTFQKSFKEAYQDPEIIKAFKLENASDIDMFTKMKAAEKRKAEEPSKCI